MSDRLVTDVLPRCNTNSETVSLGELSSSISVALMLIGAPISGFNNRPKEDHADQERYCPYRPDHRQFPHERASFRDCALCLSDLDYENVKVSGDNVATKKGALSSERSGRVPHCAAPSAVNVLA